MSHIARSHTTLSMEKRAVLQRRKVSSNVFKSFPQSPAQQRIWLIGQFEPANPIYHIATSWHLHRFLDVLVLGRSINHIIQRHNILRALFFVAQDQQVQVTTPQLTLKPATSH